MYDENNTVSLFTSGNAPFLEKQGFVPWVYANDSTNPALLGLLNMFYEGAFNNSIGIMVVKNSETGEEETVLVGLLPVETPDGEYVSTIPIAKLMTKEESASLLAPDGDGGYIDNRTEQ